jgi:hypothetical protein
METRAIRALISVMLLSSAVYADVPRFIPYSGRLTDGTGWGQTTTVNLTVLLYTCSCDVDAVCDSDECPDCEHRCAADATPFYEAIHTNVQVVDGYFAINIGMCNADALCDPNPASSDLPDVLPDALWITIMVDGTPKLVPWQPIGATPYTRLASRAHDAERLGGSSRDDLEKNLVPPGTIIWWWRPTADTLIPEGYVICDGREIPSGPFAGHATPDLMNHFVMGVSAPEQHVTGGANTINLAHLHGINEHATVNAGSHAHTANSHNHRYARFNNWNDNECYSYASNGTTKKQWFFKRDISTGGGTDVLWAADPGEGPKGNTEGDFYTQNTSPNTNSKGSHKHSVPETDTNSALSTAQDIRPAFVGLLPLMRR